MYFAAIDSESLANPTILNDFVAIKTVVEYEPHSSNKYHHVFLLKITDEELTNIVGKLSEFLKPQWYVLYWNKEGIKVQFKDEFFNNPKEALEYGQSQGIEAEFLNFGKYIQNYKNISLN